MLFRSLRAARQDRTALSWTTAALIHGYEGLVPWHRLRALEGAVHESERVRADVAGFGAAFAVLATATAILVGIPGWAVFAGAAAVAGALGLQRVHAGRAAEPFTDELRVRLDSARGYDRP